MKKIVTFNEMTDIRKDLEANGFKQEFAGIGACDYVNHETKERYTSYYRSRSNSYYFYDNTY